MIILAGLPLEFEAPRSQPAYPLPSRRFGCSLGPVWLEKRMAFSPLAAIPTDSWKWVNQLTVIRTEDIANQELIDDYAKNMFENLTKTCAFKRHAIILGGANNILNKLDGLKVLNSVSHIFKISPLLSMKPKTLKEQLNHMNYAGELSCEFLEKTYHIGLDPNYLTQQDIKRFEEKTSCFPTNPNSPSSAHLFPQTELVSPAAQISAILSHPDNSPTSPVLIHLDTEVLPGSLFPGTSLPGSTGLTDKHLFELADLVGSLFASRQSCVFLITHYTPGVEHRKSADLLLRTIHRVITTATRT